MTIRFMTYNIQDGGQNRERFVLQVLKANRPDIAVLQEVTQQSTIQGFAQELDMDFFLANGNLKRRIALLSRFPIVSRQSYQPFPPMSSAVMEAMIKVADNKHICVLGIHLVPHPAILFEWWRMWETSVILHRATYYQASPCVIAGDFNAVAATDRVITAYMPTRLKVMLWAQGGRFFYGATGKVASAGFTDSYRFLHPGEDGFTLPAPTPTIRLDYIFVNEPLKACLQKCHVASEPSVVHQASDHYPVMAEFTVQ
jgi:endonuclease/exonuclease/phosphatase family metal-dependent hydrolase